MTDRTRTRTITLALIALFGLAACGRSAQAPGMEAKDLSDDRGARAGRFLSPTDNAADATDAADNSLTKEGSQ